MCMDADGWITAVNSECRFDFNLQYIILYLKCFHCSTGYLNNARLRSSRLVRLNRPPPFLSTTPKPHVCLWLLRSDKTGVPVSDPKRAPTDLGLGAS